ncbi:hypothetical protein DL240_16770 [Lujinxingia litoralis]|uniref:Uncharacterized protein n=1 Tax=Lujinxingia litoralis TaxID=2211119 RepID=A0A328C3Z1_9DELT|nr:hypothetical protein [Lujinxingia litoralis]RAL20457.1 hypothetical protein DL240_16770 [Lujinxingia litoralis]
MSALEIRDYVARARREPTTENIEALWRAVFLLKGWYFLPSTRQEGPATPMVTMLGEEAWLLAFTNVRRIKEFSRQVGMAAPDGTVQLLVLDPRESMERLVAVEDRVEGVVFNIGSDETFRAPVAAVKAYAARMGLDNLG